jgi:menaquinol-cytochrome c reductase iron-sulfur subunit
LENKSRRSFLSKAISGLLGLGFLTTLWPYLRSLVPNILYEPPNRFKAGMPLNFPDGVTFLEDRRIYIFREGNSFYSISGVCSHLGCTVKYSPFRQEKELTVKNFTYKSKGEFHCPCHGSKFYDEGSNYAGPAPRPLKWYGLEISPEDGQLVVNLSKEVNRDFRLVV